MAQNEDTNVFPKTEIEENVIYRGPKSAVAIADEKLGLTNEATVPVRFGDQPGQIIVNPLTVDKVFNYGEYFDEKFFNDNNITDFVYGDGNTTQSFDTSMPYEKKVRLFNQYQPKFFISKSATEVDDAGELKTVGIHSTDERIDMMLRSKIDAKITAEMERGVKPTFIPNPFIDAPAMLSTEYYATDEKTGKLLPSYSESPGRRAKEFLRWMDKSFPNMRAKTKASLVNRNIYGRDDLKFKMPSQIENEYYDIGDLYRKPQAALAGSGTVLGEKIYTLATDIPRATTDLIVSAIGGGFELGYDGLKNLYNAFISGEATFKDQYQLMYKGDGWYIPNLFSEKGRDLIRSFLGPDAAEVYQKRLAEDNVLVTKDQAYKILHYADDTMDKIVLLSPMLLGEAALLSQIGKKSSKKLFEEEFKLFEANNKGLKPQELVNAFVMDRKSKLPIYSALKRYLDKSRVKVGAELTESAKPVELRSMVIEAKEKVTSLRDELAEALKIKRAELKGLGPEEKSLMTPLLKREYLNTDKIKKLKIQKAEAEMFVRMAEQTSSVPKYMREMYRDTTTFSVIAAATGQQLNVSFGLPPEIGYLFGLGTLMAAQFSQNSNFPLGMRSYLDAKDYNPANMLTYFRKSGALDENMTSQEVLNILKGPDLSKFSSKRERMIAVDLAKKLNSLSPELGKEIAANIMYYNKMRKDLTKPISEGGAGLTNEMLETSFADMSGLAFFDVLEDSFYYSFSQTKTFDAETADILNGIQKNRTKLMQGLEKSLNDILGIKNIDKNNPVLREFTGKISEALNDSKLKEDGLRAIADEYIRSKTQLLEAYLHGHDRKAIREQIKAEYGDVVEMAESLLEDVDKLSFIKEAKDVVKTKRTIDAIQKTINAEFHATIANHHKRLLQAPKGIPNVHTIELSKYNDENASLARLALFSRKLAKKRASLPFQEFDIKYGNQLGTDASELGFKILDRVNMAAGVKAEKGLVSQLMKSGDENKLFKVLNAGAEKSLDSLIGVSGNSNLRDLYITKIRNTLPDNLKNQPITDLDIVSFINRSGSSKLADKVGIALNLEQTQNLYSALSAKAFKASRANDTNLARDYGEFATGVDKLFNNIIDTQGNKIGDDLLKRVNDEIIEMRRGYQDEYTTPYLSKNQSSRWTNPENATVVRKDGNIVYQSDNARFPGGKNFESVGQPNTWFDLEAISKMDDAKIVNQNNTFTMMLGRYNKQLDDYVIDENSEKFKALSVIAAIKFEKEVLRLQKTIDNPKQLGDAIEELKRKTDLLFRNSNINKNPNSISAFKYDESMNNLTGLGLRLSRDEKLKSAYIKNWIPLKKSLRGDTAATYTAMRKANEKIKFLTNAAEINSGAGFFDQFIARPNGLRELNKLKTSLTTGSKPQMTTQDFDKYVKEIVSTHIAKSVVKPTGSVTLTDEIVEVTDKTGKVVGTKTQFKAIKDSDFDQGVLNNFLNGENSDVLIANLKQAGILDDDHLKNLQKVNEFMANKLKKAQKRGGKDIRYTGQPRGLSIESYISRFYSISRDVVSPRYVITEALIQNIRMAENRMLKEMIMNPKVASILSELIVDGQKFTEQKELRLQEIFTVMFVNALASKAITIEDEMKSGQRKPEYDFSKFKRQ